MNAFQIFFIGVLTALGALVAQVVVSIIAPGISNFNPAFSLDSYLIIAILIEEIFKLILFWKILTYPQNKKSGYLLAILLGSGFASTEVLLNILSKPLFTQSIFFSYLDLFLIHILTLLIYSFCFSQKRKLFSPKILPILTLGCFVHFLFNFFVFCDISPFLLSIILLFLIVASIKIDFLAKKSKLN
jgi:hypothetical protein